MVVIYTQDETIFKDNPESSKVTLYEIYGEKLGEEAYQAIKTNFVGLSYRKYGGPLVKVVSKEEAKYICNKEKEVFNKLK